jgi:Cation transporting ATPase, C-terminus
MDLCVWFFLSSHIVFSYLMTGVIQAIGAIYAYFVVMGDEGFPPNELLFSIENWPNEDAELMFGGRLWNFDDREDALTKAQTAYFASIIVVQVADVLICKTRILSIFQQGMCVCVCVCVCIGRTRCIIIFVLLVLRGLSLKVIGCAPPFGALVRVM